MGKFIDLTGQKFGRLTIISRSDEKRGDEILYDCLCDCGTHTRVSGVNLRSGRSTSCGCFHKDKLIERNKTHGLCQSRLYHIWRGMKSRCYNVNEKSYKRYGARGIKICDEWLNKENGFINFYNWAMANGYNDTLSIDRIDNDKGYFPKNCRWTTIQCQNNNRHSNHYIVFNGEKHTISEWSKILKTNERVIRSRLSRGWSDNVALLGKGTNENL